MQAGAAVEVGLLGGIDLGEVAVAALGDEGRLGDHGEAELRGSPPIAAAGMTPPCSIRSPGARAGRLERRQRQRQLAGGHAMHRDRAALPRASADPAR